MEKAYIKQIIIDALQLEDAMITDIHRTPGGLTNKSYFATINGEQYVVRVPGSGTDELVNRQEEKENLIYGTKLGINPPMLYFNTESGLKITHKIESASPITPVLAREGDTMKQMIGIFKHLHGSVVPMKNNFYLFDLIEHYESLVKNTNEVRMEKLFQLKKEIVALQEVYRNFHIKHVPCHIDPDYSNFIKDQNDEIYLIDWEYSGMFDPLWDIANFFISFKLNKEEQHFFLTHYLERKPTKQESQRVIMHMIFQDYMWGLWSLFKEIQGDEFGMDAIKRFERAMKMIDLYKKIFEADVVV